MAARLNTVANFDLFKRRKKMKSFLTHNDGVVFSSYLVESKYLGTYPLRELTKIFGKHFTNTFGYKVWDILTPKSNQYRFILKAGKLYVYYSKLDENDLESWGLKKDVKPSGINVATVIVKSFTNKTKQYVVGLYDCGKFRCTCPDYIHNSYHECKHISRVKSKLIELEKIR